MHQETVTLPAVGIDDRGDALYLAEITRRQETLQVARLSRLSDRGAIGNDWPERARVVMAVPDAMVIVKSLQIPASAPGPVDSIIRFELAESLLDDISEFQFQTEMTGRTGKYLGLVYRRALLRDLTERVGLGDSGRSVCHQARALALGRGYLTFCDRAAGELIGLVDLGGEAASVCLVFQESIVDLAAVDLRGLDLDKDTGRKQFAVDLKTVVNFRRAALQDRGINVPLSTVVMSGERADGRLREMVRTYFPGGVDLPRVRLSHFGPDSGIADVNPELWLVALGLTAN